uniref:Twinfilin-1 n=1 Tax=Paramormyrops kingsleyae TaxID=1676925 RepID=A0A3B3QHA3_9TELE
YPVQCCAFTYLYLADPFSDIQHPWNFPNERIKLSDATPTELKDLPKRIPKDSARYHFFLYKHSHAGSYLESTVFIYSMPGYTCSVRERMLYSSCKSPLLDTVEKNLNIQIAKKVNNGVHHIYINMVRCFTVILL